MDIKNQYGLLETQNLILKLLNNFHVFCVQNDIQYSLCGGTALGAIRDNGFIPWDDDADVMMDRENFNKFIGSVTNYDRLRVERKEWIYRILSIKSTDVETEAMIDIFIVDHVPNNKFLQKLKLIMIKALQGSFKKEIDYSKFNYFYKLCLAFTSGFGKLLTDKNKIALYEKISQIGNRKETTQVGIYNTLFWSLSKTYGLTMMQKLNLHQFENIELFITEEYDMYLSTLYGDYKTPRTKDDPNWFLKE